ncbi:hypothetical protein MMC20_003015 [Loxospora ochrophaea]|nr:hypothetical protein [Loxospora ochrophaea]
MVRHHIRFYAPAVLRFHVVFPPTYPLSPPLITFTSDIFHPLVAPLTTHTYTTGASGSDPVSATDDERLPPGGFSLRHGFPQWFESAKKSAASSTASSRNTSGSHSKQVLASNGSVRDAPSETLLSHALSQRATASEAELKLSDSRTSSTKSPRPSIIDVLEYMKTTFIDDGMLDSLPLDAAGNSSAWHAWSAHRTLPSQKQAQDSKSSTSIRGSAPDRLEDPRPGVSSRPKNPGEWNWDGVWEKRVSQGVAASISGPVLFGDRNDILHFQNLDQEILLRIKERIQRVASD